MVRLDGAEANPTATAVTDGVLESPLRPLADTTATLRGVDEIRGQLDIVFNEERGPHTAS